jgi:hypothetical protein
MASHLPLRGLAERAYGEFCDAADYFWKAAKFLDSELQEEVAKLSDYFPFTGDPLREARGRLELPMIRGTFSYLIYSGNLFSSASLFESYLFLMCKENERHAQNSFTHTESKGNGIERYVVQRRMGDQIQVAQLMAWYSAWVFRDYFCSFIHMPATSA